MPPQDWINEVEVPTTNEKEERRLQVHEGERSGYDTSKPCFLLLVRKKSGSC
jgi:hypothetical protein